MTNRQFALGVMAGVCLCGGAVQGATGRSHVSAATRRHAAHPPASRPHAARPLPPPSLKLVPLLPNTQVTVPFVVPTLPIVRPPIDRNLPQTYGGGGGTVRLPAGGSFGSPPVAGGSFGGGRPMGGSFGDGRIH